jgi:hypothetical protein
MEELLQKSIAEIAATALTLLTTVVIPYGLALLRSWVKAKIALVEDQRLREGLEFALARLDATAETVVREIDQSVKQRQNGKVVRPEMLQAAAIDRVYRRLPPPALAELGKHYTDKRLKYIIRGKIESKVKPPGGCAK